MNQAFSLSLSGTAVYLPPFLIDSAKYCKPLIDARQDGIGHNAENRTENNASGKEVCQKPVDMGCQFPRCFAIVATRHYCNTGDMPLYTEKYDTHNQEYHADSQADEENLITLRGSIRNKEACDDERARGDRKEGCAYIK